MNPKLTITILAGGLGKRMNSTLPKVLHEIHGKPMLVKIIEESIKLYPSKILVVVGQYRPVIEETLEKWNVLSKITFAIQDPPLGTGHAILCTIDQLSDDADAYNIILNGDCPLLTSNTISEITSIFESDLQITSIITNNPTGSGRIIKNTDNKFLKIVEEKDCNDDQRHIKEVNIGIYVAKNTVLKKYIPLIKNENAQKEYYLTDIVEIYLDDSESKGKVGLVELDQSKIHEIANVNTIEQLNELNDI